MKKGEIIANHLISSYYEYKGNSAETIVFLHGRGRSKEDWKSYFPHLEKNGISYIALDFP